MFKTLSITTVAAIAGVALVASVVFVTPAKAQTAEELQAQISSLLATIQALQAQLANVGGGTTGGSCSPYTFTASYSQGDSGGEIMNIQKFLNMDAATRVAVSGAGSPGNESSYFGSLTKAAVIKFQNKYASEVLAPVGLTAGTGYWGPSSRAKANAMGSSCTPGVPGTTPPPATGAGATVSTTDQPGATLAPQSAARVPFTKFVVTAGATDVTIDSVTVERTGLASDAAFSGIVLLGGNGNQIGISRSLNSLHQAKVGEKYVVKAGTSETFTIGGNMASDNSARAGEVASLTVVGINTSSTVTGSLPITGAGHTINSTLTIGSVTMGVSTFDPNSAQSKEIGTTGVRIAGITTTAGSAENIRIKGIRWNQTGSAGSTDIANVVTVVGGTEYPTTVSADGKYYSSNFGSGVVVTKGNKVDIYVKADIVGGANRTVIMDIHKTTDLNITGETYGYGITPPVGSGSAATTSSEFLSGTPWFDNATLTITAGSATTIQKSATVASQNIAVNVADQNLGAFETNFKGEPVTVSTMTLTVASTTGSGQGLLTNVSIVDQNGVTVAGPIDATYTSALVQTLSFTDSITIPTGKMVYSLKGKVASGLGNGGTYIVTVTPSNWGTPTGDTTGDTVSLSAFGAFTLNTMTIKAAALDVSVSANPVAQNVTAGVQGFTFANYEFDATQSGEDVRFTSMVADVESGGTFSGAPSNMTACQIWDGATALNTGSNVVNPDATATTTDDANTFTFDQTLVVPKGTVKTLALKCNLASSAHNLSSYQWGIRNTAANIAVTGVTSGNSVTETVTASNGQAMTVASGSLTASEDAASPAYAIVKSGSTGVNHGIINFRAANEDVTLQRIGLTLTNTASSSSSDLVRVTLWDGATQIGSATFVGANTNATSTLTTPLVVPKDSDKDVTVKLDLRGVGTSQSGSQGALLAVDIDTNSTNTQGVGASGSTINATGSTSFQGTRMFSSYPVIAKQSVPSTTLINGVMDLYRFNITASAGGNGVGLHQITLNVSTSTNSAVSGSTTVTLVDVYAYTDAALSSPVAGFTNGKVITQLAALAGSGDNDAQLSSILQIPAGTTYYFKVTGTVTLTAGTGTFSGSVTTRLGGDSAYPALSTLMGARASVDGNSAGDNLVWSPNATTTSAAAHVDWTNGFNISGLPSDGSEAVTLSK